MFSVSSVAGIARCGLLKLKKIQIIHLKHFTRAKGNSKQNINLKLNAGESRICRNVALSVLLLL
jgi:hypothetical protein